jgi:hypothetical protein
LIAAVILIAVAVYTVQKQASLVGGGIVPPNIFAPEDAIPATASQASLFMKVGDTDSLSSAVSFTARLIEFAKDLPTVDAGRGDDPEAIGRAAAFMMSMKDFIEAADEIALYATSGDVSGFYVSMFVDDEKFDPLVKSGDGRVVRVEEWDTRYGGEGNAWILRPGDGAVSGDSLYAARTRIGDRSVVYMAGDENSIGVMSKAASDSEKRLKVDRRTEGPNFIRVDFDEPIEANGLKLSEAETSWANLDDRITLEVFSDLYKDVEDRLASRDFAPNPVPMLGEGEVALFADIDPAFFIYTMFPNEPDPVKSFFDDFGMGIPSQFAGDLIDILKRCRISAIAVTKGDAVSTAYLVIDTAALGAVDKFFGIGRLFLRGERALEGWDSAFNMPTGIEMSALVARRGGTILIGAGDFSEYEKTLEVSGDMGRIASRSNVLGIKVDKGALAVKEGVMAQVLSEALAGGMRRAGDFAALAEIAELDKLDDFSLTQTLDGRVDIDIKLRK